MEQAELAALHARVEEELMKIPGVAGVGFGLKEVAGRTTDELAFRVYVREKKPPAALGPGELIPAFYEGFPTDVLPVIEDEPLQDLEQHDELVGGISILNKYGSPGTLGFFATINGEDGWDNVVMVSNHHVIAEGSPRPGDEIFQPKLLLNDDNVTTRYADPLKPNPVAKIHKIGIEDAYPFTFQGENTEIQTFIDCATARLDICVSSCCHTNCGVSYRNEIPHLNVGGSNKIAGIARITQSDIGTPKAIVYKVGRRTGRTKGKVVEAFGQRSGPGKVLVIEGLDKNGNFTHFADNGDSGAAIVNEQRQLVAILHGRSGLNPMNTLACHIHPVLAYLEVTPITEANPPVPPAGQARADLQGMFAEGASQAIPLRDRLVATPRGAAFYDLVLQHRLEVIELVNHCRPVTVAWHRAKGPAFLNRAIANARDPNVPIPRQIDGASREDLLERMREALLAHGSESLCEAIRLHGDRIVSLAGTTGDLRELAGRFEREALAEEEVSFGAS